MYALVHEEFTTTKQQINRLEIRIRVEGYMKNIYVLSLFVVFFLAACKTPQHIAGEDSQLSSQELSGVHPLKNFILTSNENSLEFLEYFLKEVYPEKEVGKPNVWLRTSRSGLNWFCGGDSLRFPTISITSSKMIEEEKTKCSRNVRSSIFEGEIWRDGFVLVSRKKTDWSPSKQAFYRALLGPTNKPAKVVYWSDLDNSLPARPVKLYLPKLRTDAFEQLIEQLQSYCRNLPTPLESKCQLSKKTTEENGSFRDQTVDWLERNEEGFAVMTWIEFQRRTKLKGEALYALTVDGIDASPQSIEDQSYPLSFSHYLYLKKIFYEYVEFERFAEHLAGRFQEEKEYRERQEEGKEEIIVEIVPGKIMNDLPHYNFLSMRRALGLKRTLRDLPLRQPQKQ